jgi:hypothetical protein
MGDKKKQPPIPAPKAPPAPAKQQAPPTTAPAPAQETKTEDASAGTPAARDLSQVPVEAKDKPDHKVSPDAPDLAIGKSTITVPFDPIDWGGMMKPFRVRGVPLTNSDYDGVELYWNRTYKSLVTFWGFSPDMAITITNAATPVAIDFALSPDFPSTTERFDRETEKMLGPGKSLGTKILPLTPGIEWGVGKIIGKPFKLEF